MWVGGVNEERVCGREVSRSVPGSWEVSPPHTSSCLDSSPSLSGQLPPTSNHQPPTSNLQPRQPGGREGRLMCGTILKVPAGPPEPRAPAQRPRTVSGLSTALLRQVWTVELRRVQGSHRPPRHIWLLTCERGGWRVEAGGSAPRRRSWLHQIDHNLRPWLTWSFTSSLFTIWLRIKPLRSSHTLGE